MKTGLIRKSIMIILAMILICTFNVSAGGANETKDDGKLTFGMTSRDIAPPFAKAIIYGAMKRAEELDIDLVITNANNDVLKQIEQTADLISMGIDAYLVFSAGDTTAIIPAVEMANEAGIPVAALDSSPEGGKIDYWLMNDNVAGGEKAAAAMVEELKRRNGGQVPEGVIIEILGAIGDSFSDDIGKGFHKIVDNYPQLTMATGEAKWSAQGAFDVTADMITRYGDEVLGVFAYTPDLMGLGVVNAIKNAGYDPREYVNAGVCMGPEGRDLIKSGEFFAIVNQPCMAMGELAVQYLYDKVMGIETPKIGDTIVEEGMLWSPAPVIENWHAEGAFVNLYGPLVPMEIDPDDPRMWENQIDEIIEGLKNL